MGIRIVFSIIKRKRFGWKFSPREIQPLKLVQIELNGYTKCSPESAQERVKEVTEEGFFVAFDLTVGAKD